MNKSLLNTDIMSEVMKGRDPVVASRATAYRHEFGRYTISTIVVMEIVRGYHAAKQLDRLNDFRQRLTFAEVLDFTSSIADLAGRIDADLERAGLTIDGLDCNHPSDKATTHKYQQHHHDLYPPQLCPSPLAGCALAISPSHVVAFIVANSTPKVLTSFVMLGRMR